VDKRPRPFDVNPAVKHARLTWSNRSLDMLPRLINKIK
jgi:hypothetical protein